MSFIIKLNSKGKTRYDYINTIILKEQILQILSKCKDEYFASIIDKYVLHRYDGDCDTIYYENPKMNNQLLMVYRRKCSSLRDDNKLELHKKDLPYIPLFESEEQLKHLSLENNLISQIDNLASFSSLTYLSLYHNQIKAIDHFQSLTSLQTLILGNNLIESTINLDNLTKLEVLDLHMNQIKTIENLAHLTNLRRLNLANNQIKSIDELVSNKRLEELNLRKNLIEKLPDLTDHWVRMKSLNLANNKLVHINSALELKKLNPMIDLSLDNNLFVLHKNCTEILKAFKKITMTIDDNEIIATYIPNLKANECFIKKDGKKAIGLSNEVFALNKLEASHFAIPLPKILFANDCYIIESFIKGKKTDVSQLHLYAEELGRYIRLIHSVALIGFGELTIFKEGAEDTEKDYIDSIFNENNPSYQTNQYLKEYEIPKVIMKHKELFNSKKSVILHGNLRCDNVICIDDKISGIINFDNTLIGVPEYDLGFYYLHVPDSLSWDNFIKGYGESFNMTKIYLYAVIIGTRILLNKTINTSTISDVFVKQFKLCIDSLI